MKFSHLNQGVTSAVATFEEAADKASRAEENLAEFLGPEFSEGKIARRGAIRMAILSRNDLRAKVLVEKYCAEHAISDEEKYLLKAMICDPGCSCPE